MQESFLRPIGGITVGVVERLVDVFTHQAHDLHRSRTSKLVDLPEDLYAHKNVQTE